MVKFRARTFDVDFRRNSQDGWDWANFAGLFLPTSPIVIQAKAKFIHVVRELKKNPLERCYLFGTGPSLEEAWNCDWSDGYRVVCNTIVRDPELWKHIRPNFIVAGDAIYHFGHTAFARAFMRDLADRLRETPTCFVYPAKFNPIVERELREFGDRLIPIPNGKSRKIDIDLTREFELPGLGNVLPLLLLPLGCTLAKELFLLGFDGRSPNDKLFWSNSIKHSYPELMPSLLTAHPAFFNYFVPSNNPSKYVHAVHGDQLEENLECAERAGYRFVMLHPSWTSTLQKRFHGST